MVLENQRGNIDPLLSVIAKRFSKINPNALTWISLIFAFIAGLFFYFSSPELESINYYLIGAASFAFLNGLFDAIDGKVVIRPIMYVALSYDHRVIDGKESVGFLVAVKEALENAVELLMDGNEKKALEL